MLIISVKKQGKSWMPDNALHGFSIINGLLNY